MQVEVRGGMLPPVTKAGKSEGGAEEHASSDSSGNDAGGWASTLERIAGTAVATSASSVNTVSSASSIAGQAEETEEAMEVVQAQTRAQTRGGGYQKPIYKYQHRRGGGYPGEIPLQQPSQRSAVAGQNEGGGWMGLLSASLAAIVLFACF